MGLHNNSPSQKKEFCLPFFLREWHKQRQQKKKERNTAAWMKGENDKVK